MNAAKQACWLVCLLIALGGGGWYFVSSSPIPQLDNATLAKLPDMVATELTLHRFDSDGKLLHALETPKMYHIPATDTHFFDAPKAWVNQAQQPPLTMQATHGKIPKEGKEVIFYGEVTGKQRHPTLNQMRTFKTEELVYFLKQKHVFSPREVFLVDPDYTLSSNGMKIDLEEKQLQCLKEFRLMATHGFKNVLDKKSTNPATTEAMPAQVSSDSASFDQKKHRGEYNGHFVFSQNTTHLQANKAITQTNDKNQWVLAIATGSAQQQAHYWAKPTPKDPVLHAYADQIRYYPQKHWVELLGHAKVLQGPHLLQGEKIRFDTVKHHLFSKGSAKDRTVIIINPKALPHLKDIQHG